MNIKDITILTTLLLIFSNLVIAAEDITGEATYGTIEFSKHWEKLSAVEPTKFLANNEEFNIREIWINVNTETENSVFKLIKLPYRPVTTPILNTESYQFYEFKTSNILKSNTRTSKIIFRVKKEWVENNSIDEDNIRLNVFKDIDWIKLSTKKRISINEEFYEFESDVNEFLQYYAISAPKKVFYDEKTTSENPETIKKTETISEKPAKLEPFDKAGWIISFLLLLTLIYIFYQKNNKINHQKHKLN